MSQETTTRHILQVNSREIGPEGKKDQVTWLYLRTRLVQSWCGTSNTIRDWWKPLGISNHPRAAAPRTFPRGKVDKEMDECSFKLFVSITWINWRLFNCPWREGQWRRWSRMLLCRAWFCAWQLGRWYFETRAVFRWSHSYHLYENQNVFSLKDFCWFHTA